MRYMHPSPNAFSRTARFRPSTVGLLHRYAVRLAFVIRTGARKSAVVVVDAEKNNNNRSTLELHRVLCRRFEALALEKELK